MIVQPKEDIHLELYLSEEVILSCELSHSSSVVHWYKDGQKLQEVDRIKLKSEGPYRTLVIPHSTIEDSGEYVCDTGDDSAFFQLSITGVDRSSSLLCCPVTWGHRHFLRLFHISGTKSYFFHSFSVFTLIVSFISQKPLYV